MPDPAPKEIIPLFISSKVLVFQRILTPVRLGQKEWRGDRVQFATTAVKSRRVLFLVAPRLIY
jgi:hypothetical protein